MYQDSSCVHIGESTEASSAAECAVHCDILDTECSGFLYTDKGCVFILEDAWNLLFHQANTTAYVKKKGTMLTLQRLHQCTLSTS